MAYYLLSKSWNNDRDNNDVCIFHFDLVMEQIYIKIV